LEKKLKHTELHITNNTKQLTVANHAFVASHTRAGEPVNTVHTCTAIHARIAGTLVKIYSIYYDRVNDIKSLFTVVRHNMTMVLSTISESSVYGYIYINTLPQLILVGVPIIIVTLII